MLPAGNWICRLASIGQQPTLARGRCKGSALLISRPLLCFDLGTTHTNVLASGSLPENCPKNGDLPEVSALIIGSTGVIGWHNPNLKLIVACIAAADGVRTAATCGPLVARFERFHTGEFP